MATVTREEFEALRKWECDPVNAFNCDKCHYNMHASGWQGAYPCGQFHCWVTLNCKSSDSDEE